MVFLAELNENNICMSVKATKSMINDGKHVEIESLDSDYIWRKYENGQWSEEKYPPPEPEPQPAIKELIYAENLYQTALLEMQILGG